MKLKTVPTEIQRTDVFRPMLAAWNEAIAENHTLEMTWPALVAACPCVEATAVTQQHTPQPWPFTDDSADPSAIGHHPTHTSEARKVACVNACAGIPTEVLQTGVSGGLPWRIPDAIDLAVQRRAAIEQLDELLAALQDIAAEPWSPYCAHKLQEIARAAIAKVRP